MLIRAVFWIGVVALVMPHASGAGAVFSASSEPGTPVVETAAASDFRSALVARLSAVKAEIEAARQVRAASEE